MAASVGVRVTLNGFGHRVPEEASGVLPGDLLDVLGREALERLTDDLLRVRPGAVEMRVVGLEQEMVDADAVTQDEGRRIFQGSQVEVTLPDLGGLEVDALPRPAQLVIAADVIEPVEQARHPADTALGQGN